MLCSFCCSFILYQCSGICCKPAVFLLADRASKLGKKIGCQTLLEIAPKQEKTRLLLVRASTGVNTRFRQHIHTIKKQQDFKFLFLNLSFTNERWRNYCQTFTHSRRTDLTFPAAATVCLINQQEKKNKKAPTPTLTPQSNGQK